MPATRTTSGLFAGLLRRRRKQLNLTQGELAERVGLTTARICGYERGVNDPSFFTLLRLAAGLNFRLGDLQPIVDEVRENLRRRK